MVSIPTKIYLHPKTLYSNMAHQAKWHSCILITTTRPIVRYISMLHEHSKIWCCTILSRIQASYFLQAAMHFYWWHIQRLRGRNQSLDSSNTWEGLVGMSASQPPWIINYNNLEHSRDMEHHTDCYHTVLGYLDQMIVIPFVVDLNSRKCHHLLSWRNHT